VISEERQTLDPATLREEVAKLTWWHSIDLGHGIVTPGNTDPATLLRYIPIPQNLQGMSVLDIGAWDGFYSFEAERRGARRVLATDSWAWSDAVVDVWNDHFRALSDTRRWKGQPKAPFEFARRVLNSKVEDMNVDVMDLAPENVGTWDVVLFLGVLYHLRHPLLALERVASVTNKLLVLETAMDMIWHSRPAVAFYPDRELDNDVTNWFGPNPAAVAGMLKSVGFRKVRMVRPKTQPMLWLKAIRAALMPDPLIRPGARLHKLDRLAVLQRGRGVFGPGSSRRIAWTAHPVLSHHLARLQCAASPGNRPHGAHCHHG
jgi:tRNA (mo5U34)-methyltransferase